MRTCPNCHQAFKKVSDRTYRFAREHLNPTCPVRFQAAAHTLSQLRKNIRLIYQYARS